MAAPKTLDIVIPMAGHGSRFSKAGFQLPKPLIDVRGQPMIRRVIANLSPQVDHRFIFLVLNEHLVNYGLADKLCEWAGPQSIIVPVKDVTEGAACTVLLAERHLSANHDMLIANSDQLIDGSLNEYVKWSRMPAYDGTMVVFEAEDEKWSFARLGPTGDVVEVAEKKRISKLATAGLYYFRRGSDFVTATRRMIGKNIRVNNEFYVCPVYNEMIAVGQRVVTWKISQAAMHGVGTPEDLEVYLKVAR